MTENMDDMTDVDDFEWMDRLQDESGAVVDDAIPFEPDRELRDETPHEEPKDAEAGEVEQTVAEEMASLETDIVDIGDRLGRDGDE